MTKQWWVILVGVGAVLLCVVMGLFRSLPGGRNDWVRLLIILLSLWWSWHMLV